MSTIKSTIDPRANLFRSNAEAMSALVKDLREKVSKISEGGGEQAREKHIARGKLLPRDRINALLDSGSPFLEFSQFAGFELYEDEVPCGGIISGIGRIGGRECVIAANDATVKGGTYYPITVKKHLRAQEIAGANHLPCLYLVDSDRAYGPRFLWMWPNARISVMGGAQAASVLAQVRRDNLEARGESCPKEHQEKFIPPIREQYETQGHPYYASARLWDDGVIDPAARRTVLGLGISAALNAPLEDGRFGLFRM